jgi:hypothetical protein
LEQCRRKATAGRGMKTIGRLGVSVMPVLGKLSCGNESEAAGLKTKLKFQV